MAQRDNLLASITATIADYRAEDLTAPTPEHVERWVNQFDAAVQVPILQEMDHVLDRTYFSRKKVKFFLENIFKNNELVGNDPCTFWNTVKFLDIQGRGASQTQIRALFDKILKKNCGFSVEDCSASSQTFIYLDDAIFSGARVGSDLTRWIKEHAPVTAKLHVIVIADHKSSYYNKDKSIEAVRESGKSIEIKWHSMINLEDRRKYTDDSDVLRPTSIPADPDVQAYAISLNYAPQLRNPGHLGKLNIFSSPAGRHLLEQEFLKAGVRIRRMCPNLNEYQRPLGNMVLASLGFGSLIVTFRNCPNNAPLALWAGDPWYPLFQRTTNSDTSLRRFMAMLAQEDF